MVPETDISVAPMSGRRAEAARNDGLILQAARDVFVADPHAPISAVAERAGVGIGALYRRYESKDVLLQRLCGDGLDAYIAEAEAALDRADGDAWETFAGFMRRVVEVGAGSLTRRLAGTFTATPELYAAAARAGKLNVELVDRAKSAGVLRADVEVNDLSLIFEQLAAVRLGDEKRSGRLRQRYLALLLEALRARSDNGALPGPAPTDAELRKRWAPTS